MSKDKQIEEMAKELTAYEKKLCERLPKDKCLLTSAVHAQVSCDYCKIAEFLVNAGYRKQSEGEWTNDNGRTLYKCSVCGRTCPYDAQADDISYWTCNYCPICGAKMRQEK